MPHQRPRALLSVLEKRLAHFPIVGVLGARQAGKSTLLRDLLGARRAVNYVTFDRLEYRNRASRQPTLFLQGLESPDYKTVCLDEIQKVPVLFDTLKAEVDEKRRPGRFLVSGSTEFSKKKGIYESLTGRIALLRLFPLNIAEIFYEKLSKARAGSKSSPVGALSYPLPSLFEGAGISVLKRRSSSDLSSFIDNRSIEKWFHSGGMPGMFAVRDHDAQNASFENWLETTCTRDVAQFDIRRFDPELARAIWFACAQLDQPGRSEIASAVSKLPRQIDPYLEAFKSLFVLYEVPPYQTSTGNSVFYAFDAGVARFSGAPLERAARIWFLNELFSQFSYAGYMRPEVYRYQSARGAKIDFVVKTPKKVLAFTWTDEEAPSTYGLRAAQAFRKKHPDIAVVVLAPCQDTHTMDDGVYVVPWNAIV